jgi:predicted dehydrogenase
MLKVAIVGCGKIADAHASEIQRIPGCEIVAVTDREPLMASQLAERFRCGQPFSDLSLLLEETRPDVVHITTPPDSHFDLARQCLERGCHVYVEKPATLSARHTQALVDLATRAGLKFTVGHDDQFSHVARRTRDLIQQGYLGGAPVHIESYYCYDLSEPGYARAVLGDANHWIRRLPGRLLHNIISHGIARISEFLTTDTPVVVAYGFVSPRLKAMGEIDIVDELRVIVAEEERMTASFTFSSQMRPCMHQCRIFGPRNGLVLDQDHETLLRLRGQRFKSYGDKFIPPILFAQQHLSNLFTNVRTFTRRDFHMKSGMKYLIEAFYDSIRKRTPPPIAYREIVRVATIMDAIFDQLHASAPERRSSDGCRSLVQTLVGQT